MKTDWTQYSREDFTQMLIWGWIGSEDIEGGTSTTNAN